MSDLDLLRRYEPIVRYTQGEMFFPTAVDQFVAGSGLWLVDDQGQAQMLAAPGELDLDRLAQYDEAPADHTLYLSYASEPLAPMEYQRWLRRPDKEPFRASGRLARVPLLSRIGDSFFDLSLLIRGSVPGGFGAAADIKYKELLEKDGRRVYYGRVHREGGWIVLHYLYFFTMNNWRSGFYGINDHESDWEQAFVYLVDSDDDSTDEAPQPLWVAYASHDFSGDDLRRRWDDPSLVKEGDHPVIYAGAGSHASYFEPGEYVMGATPRLLEPVKNGAVGARKFWVENLRQGDEDEATTEAKVGNAISVPFVDYARGDGKVIGPGGDEEWSPIQISDEDGWVDSYRGLWGLDTRDPFGGERAPAGAKYNRDGSVRQAWYDPLGWAGLDKVYPPQATLDQIDVRLATLADEAKTLQAEVKRQRTHVRNLALDVEALQATEYFSTLHAERAQQLTAEQAALQLMQADLVELSETQAALRTYKERAEDGNWGAPQAHIKHSHPPEPSLPKQSRAVEVWAAVSGALALLLFVGLLIWQPENWAFWAVVVAIVFGAVESATRGRIGNFLMTTVVVLALVSASILVFEFWRWVLLLGLIAIVIYMIRDNLMELRT